MERSFVIKAGGMRSRAASVRGEMPEQADAVVVGIMKEGARERAAGNVD